MGAWALEQLEQLEQQGQLQEQRRVMDCYLGQTQGHCWGDGRQPPLATLLLEEATVRASGHLRTLQVRQQGPPPEKRCQAADLADYQKSC